MLLKDGTVVYMGGFTLRQASGLSQLKIAVFL